MGPRFRGDDIYQSDDSDRVPDAYSRSSAGGWPNAGSRKPASAQAARTVLESRHAMGIGPTPPGTGENARAAPAPGDFPPPPQAPAATATSPTVLERPPAGVTRLTPTSMTVAPGLT